MAELPNLLDEAMGFVPGSAAPFPRGGGGVVVLVEDCVETSGAFLLHHFLKRALSSSGGGGGDGAVIFLAFAQPFAHYDRLLRKLGCNLSVHWKNNKLHFIDLLEYPGIGKDNATNRGFFDLYREIQRVVEGCSLQEDNKGCVNIMIDDLSFLEIAAHGSMHDVLDFLHYCVSLTFEMDCALVILNHEDIYAMEEDHGLLTHLRYFSDFLMKVGPLNTGLAADVHGQLTIVNKEIFNDHARQMHKVRNFHFKVKENGVETFYPGSRH